MKVHGVQSQETTPLISVVVPTFRRVATLRRCLDALIAQRIDPTAFEIVVVDDGREDSVREVVLGIAEWIKAPQIRYLRPLHGQGHAGALNRGWRAAKGALIAFTDDDTTPAPDWLEVGARAFEANRHWVALSGRVVATGDREGIAAGPDPAQFATTNVFVWRTALEAVGGFDQRFAQSWREDPDLQFRLLAQGGAIGHCAQASVERPVRVESWGVCLRRQRNSYFDALLYKKHPRLYRERIRRIPPLDYYMVVAAGLAAPLLWAADEDIGATMSALIVVALVLRLAWKRLRLTDHSPRRLLAMLATSAVIPFLSVYWRVRGALRFRVLFL